MVRNFISVVCFTTFSLLVVPPLHAASVMESNSVRVLNFPETQQIKGSVSIEGAARSLRREGILLSPSRRNELGELFHAGYLESDGYTSVSLFVQGEIKSTTFLSGTVGVFLIPDEEPILRAFKESKQIQFPIEAACSVKSGDSEYFSCELSNQNIGFSRYRIYLYNTLNKSAEVNVYLYVKK